MNRKRMILAVLMVILAFCMLYAYIATPRLEKAPPRQEVKRVRSVKADSDKKEEKSESRIDFSYLSEDVQDFPGASRDIFNFKVKRVQTKRPPVVSSPPVVTPQEVVPIQRPVAPVDVVNKSLSQFTFIGFLEKEGEKTVFLSSNGNLYLVKSGERFGVDQEFYVESIVGDILRVNHKSQGTIELKLIEQQKLNSAVSAPAKLAPVSTSAPQTRPIFQPFNRQRLPQSTVSEEESSSQEIDQEDNPDNPEEEQGLEIPENGEGIEGDGNGTNQ